MVARERIAYASGAVSGSTQYFSVRSSLMGPDQLRPKPKSYVLPSASV